MEILDTESAGKILPCKTTDFEGNFSGTVFFGNIIFGLSWAGDQCAGRVSLSGNLTLTLHSTYLLKLMLLMALLRSFSSFSTGNNNHFLLNVFFLKLEKNI